MQRPWSPFPRPGKTGIESETSKESQGSAGMPWEAQGMLWAGSGSSHGVQVPGGVVVLGPAGLAGAGQEELPLSYNKMQVFLSLKGFSDAGIPISRGSFLACSSQYSIRSAEALDTCRARGGNQHKIRGISMEMGSKCCRELSGMGDGLILQGLIHRE